MVVEELRFDFKCLTRILISERASQKLAEFLKFTDNGQYRKTLEKIAQKGFWNFQGVSHVVRPEGEGVYAIGIPKFVYRLAGFYSKLDRVGQGIEFVATDSYMKPGQKGGRNVRGPEGDRVCDEAARIRDAEAWIERKISSPRIVRTDRVR